MSRLPSVRARLIAVAIAAVALLLQVETVAHASSQSLRATVAAQALPSPPPTKLGCTINVAAGTNNCAGVTGLTILSLSGGQSLVRMTLTLGQMAYVKVTYNAPPTGFSVNIGDSATNDGYGGDYATQSNDAEMMVFDQTMSVWGRDGTPAQPLLSTANAGLGAGSVATFNVGDRYADWRLPTATSYLYNPWLYALNGQPDTEGPVNYDVYAAFNRVINGTYRTGTGVSSVYISLMI